MQGLPYLRKPKTLRSLGRRRNDGFKMPEISREKLDLAQRDEFEDRVARDTGDRKLAQRVSRLRLKYPYGTVPELITLDWLEGRNERYIFQAQLFGGWVEGGLVPDFTVHQMGRTFAWLVQGTFWHNKPGRPGIDAANKMRLEGSYVNGQKINKVIEIWETRIMRNHKEVLENALAGYEMGP